MLQVVKFEKPNCAPCVAVSQMLNQAKIDHEKVNYIAAIDLAQELGVRSVPTVFAVKEVDGKKVVVHSLVGSDPQKVNEFITAVSQHYNVDVTYEEN